MSRPMVCSKIALSIASVAALCANASETSPIAGDLFSFANGGRIVEAPEFPEMSQMDSSPINLIDDSAATDWTGEAGVAVFMIELAELTELHRLSFDTAGLNHDAKSAKGFRVEVSQTSAEDGFTEVLSGTLKMVRNGQSFAFKPEDLPRARWVRLTILGNYGDDYTGITGFHGYGKQLTQDATMPDLTGKYEGASGLGLFNISDTGDRVTGCYAFAQGTFEGEVEGRVLKLAIVHGFDGTRLTGLFQMMPGDRKLVGIVRNEGASNLDFYASYYSAEKESGKPNGC